MSFFDEWNELPVVSRIYDGASAMPKQARPRQRGMITTTGTIRGIAVGFVYVGRSKNGLVKVGMSRDPLRRCSALGIKLFHSVRVVGAAAKDIETEALRLCGARQGSSEWTQILAQVVAQHLDEAFAIVGRRRWVDPNLSEETARMGRISACSR